MAGGPGRVREAGSRVEGRNDRPRRRLANGTDGGNGPNDHGVSYAATVTELRDPEVAAADVDIVSVAGVGIITTGAQHFIEAEVLPVGTHRVCAERFFPTRVEVDPVVPIHRAREVDAAFDLVSGGELVRGGDGRGFNVRMEATGEVKPPLHVEDWDGRTFIGAPQRGGIDEVLGGKDRELPRLEGGRWHDGDQVFGVRSRRGGCRRRKVIKRVDQPRRGSGGERLGGVVAVVGENLQAHLVELREDQLQPTLDAEVGFSSRRLLEFDSDVVGVVQDKDGRTDQLQRVIGTDVHPP